MGKWLGIPLLWWRLIHILGVAAFLAAHGISVGVAFKVRGEAERERVKTLLQLSSSSTSFLYLSLVLLIFGGVGAGFAGGWWGAGWLWVSIGILVITIVLMYALAMPYYRKLRKAIEIRASGNPAVSDAELKHLIRSPVPIIVALTGFGGLIAIFYLMILKPF